ncbi:receptor-type tyrosine-protein phosphatase eta [Leucoraja erinacea]|uniref:receptor-type tyrosine-protein phosphatase eta n=1 Tax=Leucoraja erinaceus TaxID=7782 RepID=UPI002454A672|nr:receptor-type tyrosine-protein phosphatase eta [Leucoraja erinacea]
MITGNEFVTVAQLNPGTVYTFSVFTLAADNTSADPVYVSSTTVPSKPGAITVMALSNVSISLSLGRPVDMGVTQYNFSIIYGSASSSDVSFNEITNSTKIQDLQSGTNYTISVTTVVQDGVKSEAVVLNQFTSKCEAFSRVCNGADHRPEARKKESRSSFRSLDLGDRVCFDCDLQKD